MRTRTAFSTCLLLVPLIGLTGTAAASQVITPDTLEQTLQNAQAAIGRQEYEHAFELYDQAARWGHKGAQYVLGELYVDGRGVASDPVRAYAWLSVAAEAPDRDFRKARKRVEGQLSPDQKAEAERMAAELSAVYGMDAVGIHCKKEARVGSNIKRVNCYHRNATSSGGLIVPDESEAVLPAS